MNNPKNIKMHKFKIVPKLKKPRHKMKLNKLMNTPKL